MYTFPQRHSGWPNPDYGTKTESRSPIRSGSGSSSINLNTWNVFSGVASHSTPAILVPLSTTSQSPSVFNHFANFSKKEYLARTF